MNKHEILKWMNYDLISSVKLAYRKKLERDRLHQLQWEGIYTNSNSEDCSQFLEVRRNVVSAIHHNNCKWKGDGIIFCVYFDKNYGTMLSDSISGGWQIKCLCSREEIKHTF